MMKKESLSLHAIITFFLSLNFASMAEGQLVFTIDTYTTDQLSFSISGSFSENTVGFGAGYLAIKNDWSNNFGVHTEFYNGAPTIVSNTITIGGLSVDGFALDANTSWSDAIYWVNPAGVTNAIAANTIVAGSMTLTGIGAFDPTDLPTLELVSGWKPGDASVADWARFEANATTANVIPEHSTYALMIGIGCLGLVIWKRRRATSETQ